MIIEFAKHEYFDNIHKLWGANRSTLGLMPKDAFKECINKKWIIIAREEQNLLGYLQFRFTARNQTLSIVHLCVVREARGRGLAEKLLDKLVVEFRFKARGIKLSCRSDYHDAIRFWTRYNFQPKINLPSRGADPSVHLVVWWFSFGQQDLFSLQQNEKTKAVLDFNIIAKLMALKSFDSAEEEVIQLQSDWLVTEVEYFQTAETLSEIFRDNNQERKQQSRDFIKTFPELNIDKTELKTLENDLLIYFSGNTDNDRSDRRQVAETILSGFPYFVTLDAGILRQSTRIQLHYQLKIVTPSTLIAEIDMVVNAEDYYPNKLSGNNLSVIRLLPTEKNELDDLFLQHGAGEKKHIFNNLISELIARPTGCVKVVKEQASIVALFGFDESENNFCVPLIRTKQYALRQTLFIQNITDLIKEGIARNKKFVVVTDPYLTELEKQILKNHGFFEASNGFTRGICEGIYKAQEISSQLDTIRRRLPQLNDLINSVTQLPKTESILETFQLEKLLWPLKISDSEVPCYIVPIKPFYAKELFDTKAAKSELFGAQPNLIWSQENVYYRNINPNIESFPARILWYASTQGSSPRQKSIVASSYLNEVIIGPAKELYRKHQKFGVYSWQRDISKLAGGDAFKQIKVLRFSDSESFIKPVSLVAVKKILLKHNESDNNFQSPLRIKNSTFMELYAIGQRANSE